MNYIQLKTSRRVQMVCWDMCNCSLNPSRFEAVATLSGRLFHSRMVEGGKGLLMVLHTRVWGQTA
jgi:hypothetical protein